MKTALALLFAALVSLQQQTAPAPLGNDVRDLLQRVQAAGLESSRNRITVYYNEGHEPKALRLRALVEQAS